MDGQDQRGKWGQLALEGILTFSVIFSLFYLKCKDANFSEKEPTWGTHYGFCVPQVSNLKKILQSMLEYYHDVRRRAVRHVDSCF